MQIKILKLKFLWDDGEDILNCIMIVPYGTDEQTIMELLQTTHEYLCTKDQTDYYGTNGRTPEALLDYVCEHCVATGKWRWAALKPDIELELE